MNTDDKHSLSSALRQRLKEELSNPEFIKLLEISAKIGELVFKLEEKYNLPDTDKAMMPSGDG